MHESKTPASSPPNDGPYAVFQNADFVRYLTARFIAAFGGQMLVVTVDWELYERTGSALALGFVGLSMMIPMILLTLPAGHLADTFNRKKIILAMTGLMALASLGFTFVSAFTAFNPLIWSTAFCASAAALKMALLSSFKTLSHDWM